MVRLHPSCMKIYPNIDFHGISGRITDITFMFVETMLRTQTSPFYERFLEDHMAAQAFTLHLDEAGREEMADTLDELFDISARYVEVHMVPT